MVIFEGNEKIAYRDPTCFYHGGKYHLFFTVSELDGEYMYNRIGRSTSEDLVNWTEPVLITERSRFTNYCSPGNIIQHNGEYVICFTSYPMPEPYRVRHWANDDARLFTMRTKDFEVFSEPRILNPKTGTDKAQIGRMIDPFIIEKDGYYYIYFKQNGVSFSISADMESWEFLGNTSGGENACVIEHNGRYLLIHSPENGVAFSESEDLLNWREKGHTVLYQDRWEWSKGRLTAAFATETAPGSKYRYIMFFHGSRDVFPETHGQASLAYVFTDDFKEFYEKL